MKREHVIIIAIIVIALLTVIYLLKSSETHKFKILWDGNTEPDMKEYWIYLWQGFDTLDCPFNEGTHPSDDYLFRTVPHDGVHRYLIETNEISLDGRWLRAAAVAVDDSGNVSAPALSNFYWTEWAKAPEPPKNMEIER